MGAPVSIILDKRWMCNTGENKGKYPVKIRVNFKVREGRKNRYVIKRYHTGIFCRENEFTKYKRNSTVLLALSKAQELYVKRLPVEEFGRLFISDGGLNDIKSVFESVITGLREEGREGTAQAYGNALASLLNYGGEYLTFGSITPKWLRSYERNMVEAGRSINTVGMYLRALRAVFNIAIDLRIISRDHFPFGRRKYVIPTGKRKVKKAFTQEEKNIILSHRSKRADVNRALDFWIYLYFSSGCNMADVAYLQNKNIDGKWVTFERKKTEITEREKQTIEVLLTDRAREIISRHGNRSLDPNAYVFPILEPGLSPAQQRNRIKDFIKEINQLLAVAQSEINATLPDDQKLKVKLTTGTARYTVATLLRERGIDLKEIAQALGHGSEATTEHYTEVIRNTQTLISKMLST